MPLTLHDESTGSRAEILPEFGMNCYRFVAVCDGGPVEVLWAEPQFETGTRRPSGSGIPVLFPFPGRIGGTALIEGGHSYPLEPGDGRGNAIHGFVLRRPWRIVEHSARHVAAVFQASIDQPELVRTAAEENATDGTSAGGARWPSDFSIALVYRLSGNSLSIAAEVRNAGERPLPFGFGVHPYFRIPLGEGRADECRLSIPAERYWEQEAMLPTGRRLPAAQRGALDGSAPLGDAQLDDVFTNLRFEGGRCAAWIDDSRSGRRVTIEFGPEFQHLVVYTPPHREAVCIEPYTCAPDAARLEAAGIDAGWRRLGPGESFRAEVTISVR